MKQEILLHFIAEARFQSIEVFGGYVEFNAVPAELDFVDALMETVRNEPVFADEIVFEFIGHGIQLPVGKFEGAARLFFLGFPSDKTERTAARTAEEAALAMVSESSCWASPSGMELRRLNCSIFFLSRKQKITIARIALCKFNDTRFRRKKIAHFLTLNRNFC